MDLKGVIYIYSNEGRLISNMLPTGTVTFLFTDIEGSTPLWEREPEKMAAALQTHNAALRKTIEAHSGVIFKTVGDEFQAAFPTASQALRAAIDGQRALVSATWNALGPLKVRMGLHTGKADLDPSGDEYEVSHTKNRVGRIMSAAHGRQVLVSLSTAELLRGNLPSEVTLRDLGEHHLKGLRHPEHIFQVLSPGLPSEFTPLDSQTHPQQNQLTELIALATTAYTEGNYDFLDEAVYSTPLTDEDQVHYTQLLGFARSLQLENPAFETVYHHMLHLYVLNGSRLNLLKTIDRRLRGLAEMQGALLLVSGVSGIGKTSLVMAFQERAQQLGAAFISGRCSEQERTSYLLWQGVAHSAFAAGMPIESLPDPIGKGLEAQSPYQLKQALADWFNTCATEQPLVILLDDLHWADVDSLEILDHLTSQPVPMPILFIGTFRSEEKHLGHDLYNHLPKLQRNRLFDLIHLDPLTKDDIARFANVYHGACSPQLVAYLLDRAEGHPFFTVELLNDLIHQDLLSQDEDGLWQPPEESAPVPAFLKQLITQRISRLGSQAEQLLSIGAVVGESWQLTIVEQLLDIPEWELLEALESALKAEIISIEDEKAEIYRFSHGLIRQVLYSGQLVRRRRGLHAQIAAQFEQQQPSNLYAIAYHYYEAEQWEKAVSYCLAAGEQANQRFASYSALQWYQQALNAAERAGKVLAPAATFALYDRLGRTHMALEQTEEAEIVYSRLRDLTQNSGNLIAEGHALVNLANVRSRRYQLDLAEKTAYKALKIGEQSGDLRLLTHSHACLGALLIIRGQLDRATVHCKEVLQHEDMLEDTGQLLDMLRMSTYQATWLGEYQEAEALAHRTLKLAQKTNDPLTIAGAAQNLAFVQIESGDYHGAHHNILTTLEAIEVSGTHHQQKPHLLNLMGYLYLELGDPQEALNWDQKALAAIHDTHVQSIEKRRYSLLNQATDLLHLGKLDLAQDRVAQFESIKEAAEFSKFRYFNRYQLLMSEMHLTQHAYELAIELAREARVLAQSKGMLKNIAKSHWFEGQAFAGLMRFDEGLEHLEEAVGIVDGIQHGSLRWKIRLSLAEVLRKASQSSEGVLQQARELIDETSQSLSGSPLQKVFLASQWIKKIEELERDPTPDKITYPAGLTQREIEVLQLVARGATNQEVADALYISVRTVNTHMTNIFNKIGCENRTAASAFAIQHNLVST